MTYIVIGLLVILLLLFNWWGNKPSIHRGICDAELPKYFEALLKRGVVGGRMFVRVEPDERAVLPFIKYGAGDESGIRLVLPFNAGSELFFESVTAALAASRFPIRIDEPLNEKQSRLAIADLGRDVREASRLVEVARKSHDGGEDAVDVWFKGLKTVPLRDILKAGKENK